MVSLLNYWGSIMRNKYDGVAVVSENQGPAHRPKKKHVALDLTKNFLLTAFLVRAMQEEKSRAHLRKVVEEFYTLEGHPAPVDTTINSKINTAKVALANLRESGLSIHFYKTQD